ncbi:response regulator transcription factor [Microvirga massiliensis]|uniref:response regulator transcription factor n=1 Tax=Microvirga massiliensis TaxID=1033741 RepID=UPI00062B38C4|nr:response regulator transcription factor [Microvirga massiliensis]
MYIVVDERQMVTSGYVASFKREGVSSLGLFSGEFHEWLETATETDLDAIEGFLLGDFDERLRCAESIRRCSKAPIIALSDVRSLEETLELFTAKFDDVVRKPVHVREILARSEAIWRRVNGHKPQANTDRIQVFYDGRDAEIDGVAFNIPRRELQILEYLVRNQGRRVNKTQIYNAIYGLYKEDVEESVIEGHVSKLRKKLRQRLGYDPINAKRFLGYSYVGAHA